jgi:ABC-type multidrug transport system fused ATPase/permease subunit
MLELLAILRVSRRSLRGSFTERLAVVVLVASLAGATSGTLPAVIGVALSAIVGRSAPSAPGIAGAFARGLDGAAPSLVIAATLAATLATVALTVLSSKLGSVLAGELTAAMRVEMLRGALHASPHDVERAGRAMSDDRSARGAAAPPAIRAPSVRGAEIVKLAIARESALAAEFLVAVLTGLPQALVTLAVLAFELLATGTWIALAGALALFGLSRVAANRASRRVAREMAAMQKTDAAIFGSLGEKLVQSEELRLLGARGEALSEFASVAYRCADARARFTSALAVSGQIKSVFTAMSPLLVLVALELSGRAHDAGDVAKLLLVVPLVMARLEGIDALRTGLIERAPVLRAASRLFELPVAPRVAGERAEASHVDDGAIVFDDVRFTPPDAERPVLDGFSLTIPAGAVVGVCGPSGSGKSTLVRLLLRLDEPDRGRIRVGGVDVARLDEGALARVFAVLGQQSRLFERTLADNLALGLERRPSDDAMKEMLRRVALGELARDASDGARGLDTEFRAVPPSLSGGEQRRLLLARMLLRDARVFVLDEPEAGLPGATAESILRVVAELANGRTCLVVTHAPHLLRSDFNVVLDGGRVAAVGTHDELAASCEAYRALLAEGPSGAQAPSATARAATPSGSTQG